MMIRCETTVTWWGYDITRRCVLELGHQGDHTDGLWFFDRHGVRCPPAVPAPIAAAFESAIRG